MSDELKACPFCGNEAVGISASGNPVHTLRMCCGVCGSTGPGSAARTGSGVVCDPAGDEAIAAWNRRTVTREQVEKMARHAWMPAGDVPQQYINQVADMLRAAGFEVA